MIIAADNLPGSLTVRARDQTASARDVTVPYVIVSAERSAVHHEARRRLVQALTALGAFQALHVPFEVGRDLEQVLVVDRVAAAGAHRRRLALCERETCGASRVDTPLLPA